MNKEIKHVCLKHGEAEPLIVCEECYLEMKREYYQLKRAMASEKFAYIYREKPQSNEEYDRVLYDTLKAYWRPVCKTEFMKFVVGKLAYEKSMPAIIHESKAVSMSLQRLIKNKKIKYTARQPLEAK